MQPCAHLDAALRMGEAAAPLCLLAAAAAAAATAAESHTHPASSSVLSQPLELLVEKVISTCERPMGPGESLRRVFECVATGILLSGEPKSEVDAN